MNKNVKSRIFFDIAIVSAIAIFFMFDRILKKVALEMGESGLKPIISDLFSFNFTKNYYISFSLPLSGPVLNYTLISILGLLLAYIIYLILNKKRRNEDRLEIFFIFALFLGALSNLIDRLSLGFVIDYLDLKYFTVFNLADVMISFSAFFIIFLNFKKEKEVKITK